MPEPEIYLKFGKHKGTLIENVPANYLLWLWKQNQEAGMFLSYDVKCWIENNMDHLQDLKESGMGEV